MYKCVKTKVFVNGQTSASIEYKLGVRQGECLSPFLFAMYVNAMEEALSRWNTGVTVDDVKLVLLFYADDAVIFADSTEELQNDIDICFLNIATDGNLNLILINRMSLCSKGEGKATKKSGSMEPWS